ncbi:FUSC family protein [Pendulispora brunnea]|uniref:FUSC family protein n=1 Tax=Pendulispora brunnea TaxID=2905690 RepID=A0ABZ2K0I6_9BACT
MRATLDAIVPDIAKGLRAALATVVPFYLVGALDRPELTWVALGGWLGSLADPGGARGSRAAGIFVFATVGGVLVALAQAVSPWPWAVTLVLAASAFATSMLRAVGGWGGSIGMMLLITMCVAVARTTGTPVRDGLFFFCGATWAMLLSSIVWPVWTHRAVRRAIAEIFGALAAYASGLATNLREVETSKPHLDEDHWGTLARTHQRTIRAAIEGARAVSLASRTRRSGESLLGSNLRLLIGNAEIEFFALIAFGEELETLTNPMSRDAAARTLDALAARYEEIRARLQMRNVPPVDLQQRPDASLTPQSPVARLAERLLERSRLALTVARAPDQVTVNNDEQDVPHAHRAVLRDLRDEWENFVDAFSLSSSVFRHALRVTIMMAVAYVIAREVSPTHIPWVTITALVVLQPYPGAVVRRAIERVVGTVLGSVVAVAIMVAVHDPLALALIMFPLSAASVVTKPRSYRLFTFFLTPVFVLVAAHFESSWWTAAARTGDALIGGMIALVFALVLFPSREQKRLADALGAVVGSLERYADTMFDILEKGDRGESGARTTEVRRSLGRALGEAETSLERMLAEPRSFQSGADDAVQLVTYARRFSAALTALDLQLAAHKVADSPDRAEILGPLRAYVDGVLEATGTFVRDGQRTPLPAAPALPASADAALRRVLRHTELVASVAWGSSRG